MSNFKYSITLLCPFGFAILNVQFENVIFKNASKYLVKSQFNI
jgi:hypothetical protein